MAKNGPFKWSFAWKDQISPKITVQVYRTWMKKNRQVGETHVFFLFFLFLFVLVGWLFCLFVACYLLLVWFVACCLLWSLCLVVPKKVTTWMRDIPNSPTSSEMVKQLWRKQDVFRFFFQHRFWEKCGNGVLTVFLCFFYLMRYFVECLYSDIYL